MSPLSSKFYFSIFNKWEKCLLWFILRHEVFSSFLSLSFVLVSWQLCAICCGHAFSLPWNTPTHHTILYKPNFVSAFILTPLDPSVVPVYSWIYDFPLEHGTRSYTLEENLLFVSHSCKLWKTPQIGLRISLAWFCTDLVCAAQALWVHMCIDCAVFRKPHFHVAIYCLWLLQFFWPLFCNGLPWAWEKGCDTQVY